LEDMKRISLDVGCGSHPKGTVNMDFFRGGYNPQTGDQKKGEYMRAQNIENFIVGDALHLPFKDEAFDVVFSTQVIEHVTDPKGLLCEMNRVCKRKMIVRCPHRKGSGAVRPFHVNYFDETWFQHIALSMGVTMRYSIAYEHPIIRALVKIFPCTLRIKVKKVMK
jgi:ubiquinone/menaquinone biosynthesis C-methylase UbiE